MSTTCPAALVCTRSVASAGRVMQRHSCSSASPSSAPQRTAACRLKPSKSFLGTGATEKSVEAALARLIEDGVVKVDSAEGASYPRFEVERGAADRQT